MTGNTVRWLVLMPIVSLLLAACGGEDDEVNMSAAATATAGAALTAQQILALASDRLDATETVHFGLDIDGRTFIDEDDTIQILSAEGNLKRPDRVQASFAANLLARANVTIRIITVGAVTWWTDLVSGEWTLAPPEIGYDASILFDHEIGLAPVLRTFSDARRVPDEEIDGIPAFSVAGSMPRERIDAITAGTLSGDQVDVQVWIERATGNILRVVVRESEDVPEAERATWTLNISRHDEPVTIEPPI
ncbi:MAG TPA: LppX_LprAFG lipoprotein [Thermomicrobiales bacterium]|nr:LppX_LprAFG lipoprotein [Thermomicrobiales bacterium]